MALECRKGRGRVENYALTTYGYKLRQYHIVSRHFRIMAHHNKMEMLVEIDLYHDFRIHCQLDGLMTEVLTGEI